MDKGVILYDGVCNLCNGFVQFILLRDPKGYFHFASLQSTLGQQILAAANMDKKALGTVILLENKQLYTHSDAPLRIARKLPGAWPVLYGFILVPKFIRDAIYRFVARNRYNWFGKQESCLLPRPEWKTRFLDV